METKDFSFFSYFQFLKKIKLFQTKEEYFWSNGKTTFHGPTQKTTKYLPEQDKSLLMKTCRIVLCLHYSEPLQVHAQDLGNQILWL